MSSYARNLNYKYLFAAAAALLTACVAIVGIWNIPESVAGRVAEPASETGFDVPGPIKGAVAFSQPDYPYYPSLGQMKKKADAIVKGTVLSAEQRDINISAEADREEDPSMLTYWVSSVRIDKVIKGNLSEGDVIDVKQLITGDAIGMGTQKSHGVMFLSQYPAGVPAEPINPYQGVVPVVDGIARPNLGDGALPRGLKEDAFIARVEAGD